MHRALYAVHVDMCISIAKNIQNVISSAGKPALNALNAIAVTRICQCFAQR